MTDVQTITPADVVAFWREAGPKKWFAKDEAFDQAIKERFGALLTEAAAGGKAAWADTPEGALALILVLDQFSRNIYRGDRRAFAQDEMARAVARQAIAAGYADSIEPDLRTFVYLPFEHSEAIGDQELCVMLIHSLPDKSLMKWALEHERIIRRFGRFPHRNAALGRHSSKCEQAFLDSGGFAG